MSDADKQEKRLDDQHIQTVCLMVLAGVAGVYLVYWLRPVLVPFIVACFIVSGVGPILTHLEHRFNVSRVVAAGMAFLLGVALMGIFGLTISFSIIDLANNKDDYRKRVRQLVNRLDDTFSTPSFSLKNLTRNSDKETDDAETTNKGESKSPGPPAGSEDNAAEETTVDEPKRETVEETDARAATDENSVAGSPGDSPSGSAETSPTDAEPGSTETTESESDESPDDAAAADEAPLPSTDKATVQVHSRAQPVESDRMQEATELVDAFVRDGISVVLQAFLNLVSTSIVVLIYVFFLLLGKPAYAQTGTMQEIDTQIRGYLSLKTVISIGTGAVFGLALRLFGVPMALSFGVLAFLLNFIPNIGPIVASLLPIPLILLDPSGNIVWMVSVIVVTSMIQLISGNVVEPKLMGNSSDLHPVTILLGLMFWGMMWGIIGMFLATPITAAMKIVLERFEPTRQIANIMAGRWENPDQTVERDSDRNAEHSLETRTL